MITITRDALTTFFRGTLGAVTLGAYTQFNNVIIMEQNNKINEQKEKINRLEREDELKEMRERLERSEKWF